MELKNCPNITDACVYLSQNLLSYCSIPTCLPALHISIKTYELFALICEQFALICELFWSAQFSKLIKSKPLISNSHQEQITWLLCSVRENHT